MKDFLVSRDGLALVAVIRADAENDDVVVSRILHHRRRAGGPRSAADRHVASPETIEGKIRDIAWRSPTSIIGATPVSRRLFQVRSASVDGAPDRHRLGLRHHRRRRDRAGRARRRRARAAYAFAPGALIDLAVPDADQQIAVDPGVTEPRSPMLRLQTIRGVVHSRRGRPPHPAVRAAAGRRSSVPGFDCARMTETVLDGALDLLLGGACVGCARPGRLLCPVCRSELPGGAAPAWPTPVPAGLVEPWAAAVYEGTVRAMVLGLKERRLLGLAVPLAAAAGGGRGVRAAAGEPAGAGAGAVPAADGAGARPRPHPRHHACGRPDCSAQRGSTSRCGGCCGCGAGVVDQAGLDAAERAANLAGSMHAPAAGLRRSGLLHRTGAGWWSATTC